jgi:uncharacterized protein (DUF58 family)
MIVPRRRLIILTATALLPISVLAASSVDWTLPAAVVAFLWVAAVLVDASSAGGRFDGLEIQVAAITRMTVDREAAIEMVLQQSGASALSLRVGLALPAGLTSDHKDQRIVWGPGQERLRLRWHCRALQRGSFMLRACHAESPTRWGLWDVRRQFDLAGEVRAYPNLVSGQQHIQGLFARRELGWRILRKVGKGREFEQLREYLPGDNFEDIDWKATARRRHPITRVYQVEQSQEIYVILDASRLSTRSAYYLRDRRRRMRETEEQYPGSIFERYIAAALVMAVAADRAADRFGLLIFDSSPVLFLKAGRGRSHYNACREALYNRMPRSVSPDFDELFTFIGTRVRKRALLVFLTHLDDPLLAENFLSAMTSAARRHVLMVNMCRPPGAYPLFSSPDVYQHKGIYEHLVGHMIWSSLSDTRRKLRQHGVGFALLDQGQLCSQLIGQYMEVKQRQIL